MHSEQSSSTSHSVLEFLWSPFQTIKYFYRDLSEIDGRLRDDSIVVRLLSMLTMPFRLLGGFLSLMVQNWPTSRSGFAAVASVPAFFTLLGLLGSWVLADYVRNEAWRVRTNQQYYELNVVGHPDTPESALSYAKKLVKIDPKDKKLKFQLGIAEQRAGNLFAASDAMKSIAPEDPEDGKAGLLQAHLWRASNLVRNKTAKEYKAVIEQAEKHLDLAIEADKEILSGKAQKAYLYMNYANLLEEQSPERLEYLKKADDTFSEIIDDNSNSQVNNSIKIRNLSPSMLVRKRLEALDPENYSIDDDIARVRSKIEDFRRFANRYKYQDTGLWLILMRSASEIRQFDFAIKIADQALIVVESPEARVRLRQAKSLTLRKAALSITNFDDFESYKKRFLYLCDAARAAPAELGNYTLLLQFVGKENPKPTIELARKIGLATPGDAVPIKPEWLYRICLEPEYTGLITSLIGLQEFHMGNTEIAVKNWSVAQQFDISTREFIAKLIETMLISKQDKLDHLETTLSESLLVYPEALRLRMLRGLYYFKEKKFQAAIDDFRIVVDNQPNELLLHQRIKMCYLFLGQRRFAADEQKIIDAKIERIPEENRPRIMEMIKKLEDRESAAFEQ